MTKQTQTVNFGNGQIIRVGQSYTFTNGTKVEMVDYDRGDRNRIGGFTYRITETDDGKDIGRCGQSTANSLFYSIAW